MYDKIRFAQNKSKVCGDNGTYSPQGGSSYYHKLPE